MPNDKYVTDHRSLHYGRRPGSDPGHPIEHQVRPQPVEVLGFTFQRQMVIGIILIVALFAFEIFNFDTTRFALQNLLGNMNFVRVEWATILAIAFCAIDFAGLARLFTPERGAEEPKEVWYLMGAWLLGATMNALMTWWAVSVTLLSHDLGNEVMSREQLLQVVPVFVAVLVWLTRILFIGAFTVAGDHLFRGNAASRSVNTNAQASLRVRPQGNRPAMPMNRPARGLPHTSDEVPVFLQQRPADDDAETVEWEKPEPVTISRTGRPTERTRQRPPIPGGSNRPVAVGMQAQSRNRR
jgi:hypothetical protein